MFDIINHNNSGGVMNNIILDKEVKIEDMIYEIRGKQVMLSSDVATLYQVETRRINEVIKRNINRFPDTFCFQLTKEEIDILSLRSQFATLNKNNNYRGQHFKYLPYVLTEQGIMMLSGLLKSDIAVNVNISIINAFVKMRKYVSSSLIEQKYINNLVIEHEDRLKIVEKTLSNFKEKSNHLFFAGQIYDAYSLLIDIFNKAKEEIIIIDNYIDKSILDILSKTNKKIKVITSEYNNQDYNKYKEQYNNIELTISNLFHDRFIIIDKKTLYHSGASFKDLGKKCFEISKIDDEETLTKKKRIYITY